MQLIVDKLEKSFGVQEVFKDVSFMIAKESLINWRSPLACRKYSKTSAL